MSDSPAVRRFHGFRWDKVALLEYKSAGSAPFKDVTRQTLFLRDDLAGELRYFEVGPGGHSTLERHVHTHAVIVLRGRGRCLVGEEIHEIAPYDLVTVPPMTWHQFRADEQEPLGFLCLADRERDRPQLPTEAELMELRGKPDVARFLGLAERSPGTSGPSPAPDGV
jgi:mannose-6-phosphate isomerase-like protein (cupin superfamily)